MVKIYVELIKKGLRTVDDVPERIREQVKKLLANERTDKE